MPKKQRLSVVMGSPSDLKVLQSAIKLFQDWKEPVEVRVASAHRTPDFMREYSLSAMDRGIQVIVAGAGGAAHLPGMIASFTVLPVIGVPISLKNLKGLDSLLSIAQMPKGVPVATVAIDNSYNAGLLALRILSIQDPLLRKKLQQFQKKQKIRSLKSNKNLKDLL